MWELKDISLMMEMGKDFFSILLWEIVGILSILIGNRVDQTEYLGKWVIWILRNVWSKRVSGLLRFIKGGRPFLEIKLKYKFLIFF